MARGQVVALVGLVLVAAALARAEPSGAERPRAQPTRPGPARADPCPGEDLPDAVAAVGPGLELRLVSGKRVRIVDLRLPLRTNSAGEGWLASLPGSPVLLRAVGNPDRWGRVPARLSLAGGAPVDLAELLVGEGFAIVDSGERDGLCDPALLRAEAAARTHRTGAWREDGIVTAADDLASLGTAAGRFVLVEGRVVSVGERRDRTYLNFGRDWSRDFSVSVPRRSWAGFKARGLTADTIRGRRVRVRGILEARRAPALEITAADMLELLGEEERGR